MEESIREPLLDQESQIQLMEVGELLDAQDTHIKDALRRNGKLSFLCGVASGVIFELFALAFIMSGYSKIRPNDSPHEDEASFSDWVVDSNVDLFSITLLSCLGFYLVCIRILRISSSKTITYVNSQTNFALGYMVRLQWLKEIIPQIVILSS